MKVSVTYKQISEDLQKVKTENIYKIIAGALERNRRENNKNFDMMSRYYKSEKVL